MPAHGEFCSVKTQLTWQITNVSPSLFKTKQSQPLLHFPGIPGFGTILWDAREGKQSWMSAWNRCVELQPP